MTTNESASGSASFVADELTVSFTVQDVQASLAWYCDVLGFSVTQRHEGGGALRAASISAGKVRILLAQDNGAKGVDRVKGEGFSIMLTTSQNIDGVAGRIESAGGTLATQPTDMPWGARVFRLEDPDGFRIAISSAPKDAA